jgi:N-acetylglucosaminyl-diphospho-decaprenol L-rhamnosyltransferase
MEVIIIDNGSTDGSVEMMKNDFPFFRLIQNLENVGFSKANNQGMRMANGDILILLNSDTIVLENTFPKIVDGFAQNSNVGVIAPQLLNPDGSIQPSWGIFACAWTEFLFQTFLFKIIPAPFPLGKKIHPLQKKNYSTAHPVAWASGACLAVRREVVEAAGMLDEGRFMYGEDMEWCWRIRQKGFDVLFWPDAKIIHLGNASSKKDFTTWIQRYTTGNLQFIQEHNSRLDYLASAGFVFFGSILRFFLWSIIGISNLGKKTEAEQRISGYRSAIQIALHQFNSNVQ